jgi:hypothetical protein
MLVKTQYNREEHPCNYEVNDEPSLTIPDQTMSIRTLLDRYAKGMPLEGIMANPQYQEGEDYDDLPDPRRLDLSERQEFAEQVRQELAELKSNASAKKQSPIVSDVDASQGEAATEKSDEIA